MGRLWYLFAFALCLALSSCGSSVTTSGCTSNCGSAGSEILYGAPGDAMLNTFVTAVINPSTGAFSSVSISTPPILDSASMVAANAQFLYIAVASEIVGYSINQSTGALTASTWSPLQFPLGRSPQGLAVAPSGDFLYAADAGGGIDAYQINASTGALTAMPGSPFGAGDLHSVVVDPSGSFVYAVNDTSGNVLAFTIDPNGALAPVPGSPFSLPGGAKSSPMGIVDTGRFVYVTLNSMNQVAGFTVDATTGKLTPISGSPIAAGQSPTNLIFSKGFLYVVNAENGSVSGYSIAASSGALTPMTGSPFFKDIGTMVADPSGEYLYLSSSAGIIKCNINPQTGVPTLESGSVSNNGYLLMTIVQLPSPEAK